MMMYHLNNKKLLFRSFSTTTHLQFSLDKDYYKILGVGRQASQQEIKKQFFKQAKEHHPDILHSKPKESH